MTVTIGVVIAVVVVLATAYLVWRKKPKSLAEAAADVPAAFAEVKADAAKIKPAVAAVKSETAVAKTEVGGVVADVKSAFGPATGSK